MGNCCGTCYWWKIVWEIGQRCCKNTKTKNVLTGYDGGKTCDFYKESEADDERV